MFVIGILCSTEVFPEYNSERLGEAIGGYLSATDLLEKVSRSECGYVIKSTYSFDAALIETMSYLNERDRREFQSFMASDLKSNYEKENGEFIQGFLRAGRTDGLDINTVCGMMISIISVTYQKTAQQWELAKEVYSR